MKDFSSLYNLKYFVNRNKNDLKRLVSFYQEKEFIENYTSASGTVCDVGCSTGEFLNAIGWSGNKYVMEINSNAIDKATASGIDFSKNILTEENFFDVVIFRGTIQHLPNPFEYISSAYNALKSGGTIVFLATPNANSLVYKNFNTLPALSPAYNFYIPSDITLKNVLKNFDFEVIEIQYPYIKSPYAKPVSDHINFIHQFIFKEEPKFSFWKSMMNVVARKV